MKITDAFVSVVVAVSLVACVPLQKKPAPTSSDKGMTIDSVLDQVRTQINAARHKECNEIKEAAKNKDKTKQYDVQKLNVYLDTIELHLDLKQDISKDGKLTVDLPTIGELGPSGSYEQKAENTTENTLIVKFTGMKPDPKAPVDPCNPNTTYGVHD